MDNFTIKDLEQLSGIKAHTLRIWEQRYNFLKPQRTDTNIRYYSNEELKTILNISLLNKNGFKISHIDKMSGQQIRENILSLSPQEAQQERLVNELVKHMIDLNIEEFEKLLDSYILSRGIERAISHIIFPFLEKIGVLWQTNYINPAQEHLVSNIIRQKLIMGIETTQPIRMLKTSVVLFLPEGEHHEIALLYLQYILKTRGAKIYYLGTNVPRKDLAYIIDLKNPDCIFTHLTSNSHPSFNLGNFVSYMKKITQHRPLYISGMVTQRFESKIQAPVFIKKSLQEVMKVIELLN
ncbi:MAG: MerR family transcriptional regulator [Ferruginibacter sp.]